MTELIMILLTAGFTATFEGSEAGDYFCLLRDIATGQLANCVIADTPESALEAAAAWVQGGDDGGGLDPLTDEPALRVQLFITGDCGHVVWTGHDEIADKLFPFFCQQCGEHVRLLTSPWKLASRIVTAGAR